MRGARTLALRLQKAQENAQALAERLQQHPQVARVRYPGLPSHPTHAIAKRVLKGFGTILSFDLLGGAAQADAVCRNVQLIRHATSLGGWRAPWSAGRPSLARPTCPPRFCG